MEPLESELFLLNFSLLICTFSVQLCAMLSDVYAYLFSCNRAVFENNIQKRMYRNFFREYTHLQWRGYVQIHMQPVEEKI